MQPPSDMPHDKSTFDQEWFDALRSLPSEQGEVSTATDKAVMEMARRHLAGIRQRQNGRWIRKIVAAAAILIIGIFLGLQMGGDRQQKKQAGHFSENTDEAATILHEVSTLFPGQIRAIERDDKGLQLVLTDQPQMKQGTGVVIEVMKDGRFRQIITFAGQKIEIMGHIIEIEASSDGRVRLKGKDIEWNSDQPQQEPEEINIRARVI